MKHASVLIVMAGFAALAGAAKATTYNAVSQFSDTVNSDTSKWSYRFNTTGTRDGNYALMPSTSPSGAQWYRGKAKAKVTIWTQSGPDSSANMAANKNAMAQTANFCCGTVTWPAHSIYANPSSPGDDVLSFLAPKTGTATVQFSFTDIDPYGGNGIRWYVDLNAGTSGDLASGSLDSTSPSSLSTTGVQSIVVPVVKGDRINFIIDADGDDSFDSTAITATITY
jgi:hypothetical protein